MRVVRRGMGGGEGEGVMIFGEVRDREGKETNERVVRVWKMWWGRMREREREKKIYIAFIISTSNFHSFPHKHFQHSAFRR